MWGDYRKLTILLHGIDKYDDVCSKMYRKLTLSTEYGHDSQHRVEENQQITTLSVITTVTTASLQAQQQLPAQKPVYTTQKSMASVA